MMMMMMMKMMMMMFPERRHHSHTHACITLLSLSVFTLLSRVLLSECAPKKQLDPARARQCEQFDRYSSRVRAVTAGHSQQCRFFIKFVFAPIV